jgi:hypothetical protein
MARGWESKNVESQQEEAGRQRSKPLALTAEQRVLAQQRQALELTRARLAAELSRAAQPAHRQMLEQAIAAVDADLAGFSS